MSKDPVCGMEVDEESAKISLNYRGIIYYFCAPSCKEDFSKNPDKYI